MIELTGFAGEIPTERFPSFGIGPATGGDSPASAWRTSSVLW